MLFGVVLVLLLTMVKCNFSLEETNILQTLLKASFDNVEKVTECQNVLLFMYDEKKGKLKDWALMSASRVHCPQEIEKILSFIEDKGPFIVKNSTKGMFLTATVNCDFSFDGSNILETLLAVSLENGGEVTECQKVLLSMYDWEKGKLKDWAFLMLDASSKLQPGILRGNLQDFGSFDECLAIDEEDDVGNVKGRYCIGVSPISIEQLVPGSKSLPRNQTLPQTREVSQPSLQLKWTICVPDACSPQELNLLLGIIKFPFTFSDFYCQTQATQSELTGYDIAAIVFFAIVGFIMLVSTLYDGYLYYTKQEPVHKLLVAFSMYTNGKKLFEVKPDPKRLTCVEGLRTISNMWVVYGHTVLSVYIYPISNYMDLKDWADSLNVMPALATVSVDTFFVLGGMVLVYTFLSMDAEFRINNIPWYYFHRYIRLTPVLATVILIHVTLLDNMITGPMKPLAYPFIIETCEENWWNTLLYIQNYFGSSNQCIPVAWYLMVDFQLAILSPILLIPLKKYTKQTLAFAGLLACISIGLDFYVAWTYELNNFNLSDTFMLEYYQQLYTRANTWLIGVILGYFVYQVRNVHVDFKMNKVLVLVLWICSLAIMATCVFAGHELTRPNPSHIATTLHVTFLRPAWSIALCWIVFACVSGYGGPINAFLSLPIFQILGRLTYCIYLLHYSIIIIIVLSKRHPDDFSQFGMIFQFWSYFMLTLGVAIVWTLAFECPILAIEKSLRSGASKKSEKKDAKAPA